MRKINLSKIVVLCCVILIGASCVFAQDWPQWRGTNRDGKVKGFEAPQKWPSELKLRWKTPVGTGDSTPALVGDKLYVFSRQGEEEVITCLEVERGEEQWMSKYPAQAVTRPADSHPGPRSSPVVTDGKVVTIGVGGVISCVDAATGKLVWRKDPFPKVVPRFFTSFSPIVIDGMAIAHLGGAGNGAIIAYDLATGDEKWRWGEEGPEYGSPALLIAAGTKQIVSPTEKSIVSISVSDGKLLWKLPFEPPSRSYNAATPVIDGQTVIITGKGRGAKAMKVEKQGNGFVANELWSNADLAPQYTSPVLRGGLLFGLTDTNKLYCINAQTGQTAWTDATARGSRGFGSIVDAGSCLVLLTNDSELFVYKPSGEEYSELAKIKVSDTPIYAHPVLSGNRIIIKDQDNVTMFVVD